MNLTGELGRQGLVEACVRFRIAALGDDVRAAAMIFYIGPHMNAAEFKQSDARVAALLNLSRQMAGKK